MFNVATEVQELLYEWSWEGFYVACSWIMGKITKEVEFEFHETHHKKRYFIIKIDLRDFWFSSQVLSVSHFMISDPAAYLWAIAVGRRSDER